MGDYMNEVFKYGLKQFGKTVIVTIMSFFLIISMNAIGSAIFTDRIGYIAYGTLEEGGESTELYRYYFEDGDDLKKTQYEEQGYTVSEVSILSELTKAQRIGLSSVTQAICLMLLICFIYPVLWQLGTKDSNMVMYKHKTEDKLKGLKIGLISIVPSVLFLTAIVITKNSFSSDISFMLYKFISSTFYGFIDLGVQSVNTIGQLNALHIILLYALKLIVPIISFVAYYLGYKNFSIGEKIVYKKN